MPPSRALQATATTDLASPCLIPRHEAGGMLGAEHVIQKTAKTLTSVVSERDLVWKQGPCRREWS